MEMHQLRYFLAVVEEKNFTRAAEHCHVSQPSLSAQIIKLEDELGDRLFNRLGRRIELTVAGSYFEKRARNILMEADNALREIQEGAGEPKGTLQIGVTPSVSPKLLSPVLRTCKDRYPKLKIQVNENLRRSLVENLINGDLEVVISSYSGKAANVFAEPILRESLNLVVPLGHSLISKKAISLEELKHERLILIGESPTLGEKVIEFFELNDFEPDIAGLCSQVNTAKALVHCGLGLAILPETAREDVSPHDVVFKPLESAKMSRLLFALTHERRYLSSGASAFLETIREYVDIGKSPTREQGGFAAEISS